MIRAFIHFWWKISFRNNQMLSKATYVQRMDWFSRSRRKHKKNQTNGNRNVISNQVMGHQQE